MTASNKTAAARFNKVELATTDSNSLAGISTTTAPAENQPEQADTTTSDPATPNQPDVEPGWQSTYQPNWQPSWQPKWQPKSRQRSQHKSRQNRSTQATSSRSQQQLDQQIWQLHQAMVEKMLQQPDHANRLLQQLENRYQQGQLRHAPYLFWSSCLLQIDQPDLFRQAVLSNQPQAIKYRRRTALTGVLTEHERQAVLFADKPTPQTHQED